MSYFKPYKYVKDNSSDPIYSTLNKKFFFNIVGYPTVFLALGLFFLVTQIFIPLVSFKTQNEIIKPVSSSVLGIATGFKDFQFDELKNNKGRTVSSNIPKYYYLTIPKLSIKEAKVETSPNDLDPNQALGHYIGSAFPNKPGNSFIYGHSVLPAFYNPKNYKAIFSTLHNLSSGDEIIVSYNNKEYKYKVDNKKILKTNQVDPLNGFKPKYLNVNTITLMTCYPPGTKSKRLLINATLID